MAGRMVVVVTQTKWQPAVDGRMQRENVLPRKWVFQFCNRQQHSKNVFYCTPLCSNPCFDKPCFTAKRWFFVGGWWLVVGWLVGGLWLMVGWGLVLGWLVGRLGFDMIL